MSASLEAALGRATEELQSLYDGATDGILAVDLESLRVVRANRAICRLLGYTKDELLAMKVPDLHPAESLPEVLSVFEAARQGRLRAAHNTSCLRKDGSVVQVDVSVSYLSDSTRSHLVGFFRDITEQNRTIEQLRDSEQRYRLIADNVSDMIWAAPIVLSDAERALLKTDVAPVVRAVLDRFRISFATPAVEDMFGYTAEEVSQILLRDITAPASWERVHRTMADHFMEAPQNGDGGRRHNVIEMEFFAKDGSSRWCEVVSAYLRDEKGVPTSVLGITRNITRRRKAEQALRESESMLRNLLENLPDLVLLLNRDGIIQFANRRMPHVDREKLFGACAYDLVIPEHRKACRLTVQQAFASEVTHVTEAQDVFGCWWSCRIVSLSGDGDADHAMAICTDVTQERMATEAVNKEQQLLRQLLELHERERRLVAYDIHDGFAQQITGAMFRLQGFREVHALNPAKSWEDLDSAVRLIQRAIDEARRLISGLRPPILDESGIVDAIDYLVCEHGREEGLDIEFTHDVAFDRLAPPLESALFRIAQESLQNSLRHSRSKKMRIELTQTNGCVRLMVRDWGVGFTPEYVEEQRFGLQGIRERVRLLDGSVVIDSSPGEGTHIAVELPLLDGIIRPNGDAN